MSTADDQWMELALQLAQCCPPSRTAYSVGTVIVDQDGHELARGYSRETDPYVHAEESALAKVAGDPRLARIRQALKALEGAGAIGRSRSS